MTIPSDAQELLCYVAINSDNGIIIPITILTSVLGSSEKKFRGGYYASAAAAGACGVSATSSIVNLDYAYTNNGAVVTNNTKITVYYR